MSLTSYLAAPSRVVFCPIAYRLLEDFMFGLPRFALLEPLFVLIALWLEDISPFFRRFAFLGLFLVSF